MNRIRISIKMIRISIKMIRISIKMIWISIKMIRISINMIRIYKTGSMAVNIFSYIVLTYVKYILILYTNILFITSKALYHVRNQTI